MDRTELIPVCEKGCCEIDKIEYRPVFKYFKNTIRKKAGGLIIDSENRRIVLVQSRGDYWGLPKGSFESKETSEECAMREIKEETGLIVELNSSSKFFCIERTKYFQIFIENVPIYVQKNIKDNDANSVGWFNIDCLESLIENKTIKINKQCAIILRIFFDLKIPEPNRSNIPVCNKRKCSELKKYTHCRFL